MMQSAAFFVALVLVLAKASSVIDEGASADEIVRCNNVTAECRPIFGL
jgi:hypothetical protein